jgi:hypothetical protein
MENQMTRTSIRIRHQGRLLKRNKATGQNRSVPDLVTFNFEWRRNAAALLDEYRTGLASGQVVALKCYVRRRKTCP